MNEGYIDGQNSWAAASLAINEIGKSGKAKCIKQIHIGPASKPRKINLMLALVFRALASARLGQPMTLSQKAVRKTGRRLCGNKSGALWATCSSIDDIKADG